MDEQIRKMWYTHTHTHTHTHRNIIQPISFQKEGNSVIFNNMDESGGHYAK